MTITATPASSPRCDEPVDLRDGADLEAGPPPPGAPAVTAAVAAVLELVAGDDDEAARRPLGLDGIGQVTDVAVLILDAATERASRELHTVRALAGRRRAWVKATRDALVARRLRDELVDAASLGAGDPELVEVRQLHAAVLERALSSVRSMKVAIGDSPLSPDPELARHERDLERLGALQPADAEAVDALFVQLTAGLLP